MNTHLIKYAEVQHRARHNDTTWHYPRGGRRNDGRVRAWFRALQESDRTPEPAMTVTSPFVVWAAWL